MKRVLEWISVQIEKKPGKMVLMTILLFNIVFFTFAALIISWISISGNEPLDFWQAIFCTITMILDAGCISFVVQDLSTSNLLITIVCLAVIFVGVISFTGAIIGYVTNSISSFISNTHSGSQRLLVYDHVVVLNWNSRASEIVNDLLYCPKKQTVVILVKNRKEEIEREIEERLTDTIQAENAQLKEGKTGLEKYIHKKFARKISDKLTVIVRKGDVFSTKQLHDISLENAKSIIILGDETETQCKDIQKGNAQIIKTLMQVADIVSADSSLDEQKVIVEVSDEWTWDVVSKIILYKQVRGKCNIVPVRVNKVLGQLLSQFSVMPELNEVYRELLSNKGMSFYPNKIDKLDETSYFTDYINTHSNAIPLAIMEFDGRLNCYYAAQDERDIYKKSSIPPCNIKVDVEHEYKVELKNVIIIGHNSKMRDIMDGFMDFRSEWNPSDGRFEVLRVLIIDDKNSIQKMNNYVGYPFVVDIVEANIYDKDKICASILSFSEKNAGDTSILVLSDDTVPTNEIDNDALANLVFIQNIIQQKKIDNPSFDEKSLDPIIEIINPKHHDVVSNYNANNVVISNRYISKMILQIGEKDALFNFYRDLLTYDTDIQNGFESREIYLKKANRFFRTIPDKCCARDLISSVYKDSVEYMNDTGIYNPTIILGYIKQNGNMILFKGDQTKILVDLSPDDLLIVYCAH